MVEFYYDPVFEEKDACQVVLAPAPDQEKLSESLPVPADVDAEVAPMCVYRPLTPEQERHLFRKMNYLKYLAELADGTPEQDDRLAHAMSVRNAVLKHNTRLVYDIVKPYARYSRHTVPELFSEASLWMVMDIIDGFDFTKGGPFGAFVSLCVRRNMWKHLTKANKAQKRCGGDEALGTVCDHRRGECEAACIEDEFSRLRDFIWDHVDNEKTADLVIRRLGLNDGKPQSFDEIAVGYGVRYQTVQKQFDAAMVGLFGHTVNGNVIKTIQGRQKDNGKYNTIRAGQG